MQTPQILSPNLLSQLVEQRPALSSHQHLQSFYEAYHNEPTLPPFQRCNMVFQAVRVEFEGVFIVVDALDEYQVGNLSAETAIVEHLESFGASRLVTSRNGVPFTAGSYLECRITASEEDVKNMIVRRLARPSAGEALHQSSMSLEDVADIAFTRAQGM